MIAIDTQASQPSASGPATCLRYPVGRRSGVAVDESGPAGVVIGGDDQRRLTVPRPRCGAGQDVLAGALRREAPAWRDAGELVHQDRREGDREEDRAQGRVTRREQAPGKGQRDMPRVRHRPVGPAPERLDPDPAALGDQLSGQPAGGAPLGVGTGTTPLERRERADRLERSHRAG
jgi:hypothetical protein